MVRARVKLLSHAHGHAVDVAPRHHRVDQGVAPLAGDIGVGPPHAPEVARVVLGLQVVQREPSGDAPGLGRVALQHHGLLHREDRARTEPLPRERGVLDRDEVRVDAVGAFGRELEHPRAERREHQPRRDIGLGGRGRRAVHRVEVVTHRRVRPLVRASATRDEPAWLTPIPRTKRPG